MQVRYYNRSWTRRGAELIHVPGLSGFVHHWAPESVARLNKDCATSFPGSEVSLSRAEGISKKRDRELCQFSKLTRAYPAIMVLRCILVFPTTFH